MLTGTPFARAPLGMRIGAQSLTTILSGLRLRKTAVVPLLALVLLASLSGCQRREAEEQKAALAEYQRKNRACIDSLSGQPRVPILGGGDLRVDRFAFSATTIRLEDGECGTDGFETHFYWTGQQIIPNDERFTGLKLTEVPEHWRLMRVATRLGHMKRCQQSPDRCKGPATPPVPRDWPPKLVLKMENYPLDVWLPHEPAHPGLGTESFVLRNWSRADGAPRFINCDTGRPVASVSRDEWRTVGFGQQTRPNQVDLNSFSFKRAGSAHHRAGFQQWLPFRCAYRGSGAQTLGR